MQRIIKIWAFIGIDDDGDEGVPAVYMESLGMMMPLVGGDKARVDSLRVHAQFIADNSGQSLELREFTAYEVIDRITPADTAKH